MLRRLTQLGLAVVVTAVAAAPLGAQIQVVEGHPRIHVRPDGIDALRQRVREVPQVAAFYERLKQRADGSTVAHTNAEVAGFEVQSLALLYLVENRSPAYRDKALSGGWIRTEHQVGSISNWMLPYQVMGQSIALDWMWDDLTPEQRRQIGLNIVALMDDLLNYAPQWLGDRPRYANQMSDYSNQLYYHLGALAFAGAVLKGEGIADERADFYLSEARRMIVNHMIPAMNQEAGGDDERQKTEDFEGNGGWGEDMGHLGMTHPMFGRMLEAWRTATGEDFFPQVNGMRTLPQYTYYLVRPGGDLSPKGNGAYGRGLGDKDFGSVGALVSARYEEPHAAFGRRLKDLSWGPNSHGFHQFDPILWYSPDAAELDHDALPRAMHFQGQGEVVVRSGWDEQDTWVYLRSGPYYNGHQHHDQGNLLIEGYGGELFIENARSGRYATSYHNTLRVGGDQIDIRGNQVQYNQPMEGTPLEVGRLTSFVTNDTYTYAAADFSDAYPVEVIPGQRGRRNGQVTRELVVILPDIVVVRDRVRSAQPSEFLLHTWNRDQTRTQVDERSATVTVTDGAGHGWVRTLLPEQANMRMEEQEPTWLITVRPTQQAETQTFLHVFCLSPADEAFAPADLQLVRNDGQVGASLTDRSGDRWEVLFNADEVGLVSVRRNEDVSH